MDEDIKQVESEYSDTEERLSKLQDQLEKRAENDDMFKIDITHDAVSGSTNCETEKLKLKITI